MAQAILYIYGVHMFIKSFMFFLSTTTKRFIKVHELILRLFIDGKSLVWTNINNFLLLIVIII